MGAIAALLALGGIVALAAYSASSQEDGESPQGPPPLSTGRPAASAAIALPPPPLALPAPQGPAPAPRSQDVAAPSPHAPAPAPSVVPPPPSSTSPGPVPADLAEQVRGFLASDPSPEQLEQVASRLESAGLRDTATQLRAAAAARRAAPSPSPSLPLPPSPEPSGGSADPSLPARTPESSSSSASDSGSSPRPAGSGEPRSARESAVALAGALRNRLIEIQRITRSFQDAAGITTDGRYGPVTRAALSYWTGRTAPRPWVGSGSRRYRMVDVERGDGSDAARAAERSARALLAALLAPEGPVRASVESFQRATGLTVDGKYGRQTRAALRRLGVANPPRAFRRSRSRRRGGASSRRRSA